MPCLLYLSTSGFCDGRQGTHRFSLLLPPALTQKTKKDLQTRHRKKGPTNESQKRRTCKRVTEKKDLQTRGLTPPAVPAGHGAADGARGQRNRGAAIRRLRCPPPPTTTVAPTRVPTVYSLPPSLPPPLPTVAPTRVPTVYSPFSLLPPAPAPRLPAPAWPRPVFVGRGRTLRARAYGQRRLRSKKPDPRGEGDPCTTPGETRPAPWRHAPDAATSGAEWLEDDAVLLSTSSCRALHTLSVAGCPRLTPDALAAAALCTHLTALDVSSNPHLITDEAAALLARMPALAALDASGAHDLSPAGAAHLAGLSRLTSLDLSGAMALSDAAVAAVARGITGLTSLPPPPPPLPYKVDTSRPSLRTNWTRLVPFPQVSPRCTS